MLTQDRYQSDVENLTLLYGNKSQSRTCLNLFIGCITICLFVILLSVIAFMPTIERTANDTGYKEVYWDAFPQTCLAINKYQYCFQCNQLIESIRLSNGTYQLSIRSNNITDEYCGYPERIYCSMVAETGFQAVREALSKSKDYIFVDDKSFVNHTYVSYLARRWTNDFWLPTQCNQTLQGEYHVYHAKIKWLSAWSVLLVMFVACVVYHIAEFCKTQRHQCTY